MKRKLLGLKPGPVESQAHELNHQAMTVPGDVGEDSAYGRG